MKYIILLLIVLLSSCTMMIKNDIVDSHLSSDEIIAINKIESDTTIQIKDVYILELNNIGALNLDNAVLIVDPNDTTKILFRYRTFKLREGIFFVIFFGFILAYYISK